MIVLSDEPKAIVLAAERLIALDRNIANQYSVDQLAFLINDFIRSLRTEFEDTGSYMGTSGFYVFRYVDEDGAEELRVVLSITDFHTYSDEPSQQFHHNDGPWIYDESVPAEWREEDEN